MPRKQRWRRVLWILFGLLLTYGAVCWVLADRYLHPMADPIGEPPSGMASRDLPLATGTVSAWATDELETSRSKPTFVLTHGYGGSQAYWHDIAGALADRGYAVVVPVVPAHHDPSDRTTGFGLKESARIAEIVKWIRSEDGPELRTIVLVGVSMGGGASWLATEQCEVEAVVSEGSFAWFDRAAYSWLDYAVPGGSVILRPVIWIASARSGIQMSSILPVEAAKQWKATGKPALVIEGDQDRIIPMAHAKALSEAAGCPLWVVPGAGHARCPQQAPAEFVRRLEEVAKQASKPSSGPTPAS